MVFIRGLQIGVFLLGFLQILGGARELLLQPVNAFLKLFRVLFLIENVCVYSRRDGSTARADVPESVVIARVVLHASFRLALFEVAHLTPHLVQDLRREIHCHLVLKDRDLLNKLWVLMAILQLS